MRNLSPLIIILLALPAGLVAQSPHGDDLDIDCSVCHNALSWKVDKSTMTFNHSTTKYPLVGQHAKVDCRNCHTSLVFSKAGNECMSCHSDVHEQTVGFECERCHTPNSWMVPDIVDIHRRSRFPLLGAHVTADCQQCHPAAYYNPSASYLSFAPLGVECYDCHQADYESTTSPNHVANNYSTNCSECHDMNAFDWSSSNVNHNFFPLNGGHAIDCNQCHTDGNYSQLPTNCDYCHQADYAGASNPNHIDLGFPLDCSLCHTLNPGWKPADYKDHDAQYFPIYSGSHNGAWNSCTDCHQNPSNYAEFTCISCHEHNQGETDNKHEEVGGYVYNSQACYECHPTGSGEDSFNHNLSGFPLTGAHLTTDCMDCHASGYSGTPTACDDCHDQQYIQTTNPNHFATSINTECQTCHTTDPGWKPALLPNHNDYWVLNGAHASNASDCFACHKDDYNNTPNTCVGCHQEDYNQTTNPPHTSTGFSTDCATCHTETAWTPATFDHDGQYFPIYSGKHNGQWNTCADCHTNAANYNLFSCTDCHDHNQAATDEEHNGVGGYIYNSQACYECHPTGDATGSFNHNTGAFPLTGAHITTPCIDCHINGYSGTTTICSDCHITDYNQSTNPNHAGIGIPIACETCHTTNPGWQPATFPIHNNYWALQGAHAGIGNDCDICHNGNYTTTPNTCFGCHEPDYNQTTNPPHLTAQFPTDCESCHTVNGWVPSTFDHDGQYFPIYSGNHSGQWESCADCHTNPNNYGIFSCIDCHAHNQADMDNQHQGIGGYSWNSDACYACHPTGGGGAFNHNTTNFPLTGAHLTVECQLCHVNGYTGTSTICSDCHTNAYNQTTNPNHSAIGIPNTCETCHTTNPGWTPATFPIHGNYYPLTGAHSNITDCDQCHNGNYTTTPNTCFECHESAYNATTNPNHIGIGIPTNCENCHTTTPGWAPATFPIHNNYYPLTGAHANITDCDLCHNGNYTTTPNTCYACHEAAYNATTNPDHIAIGIPTNCDNCHTTNPGWSPATFPIHGNYWPFQGAHIAISGDCDLCHNGNYTTTPNTCYGCHSDDYNSTTNPPHLSQGFPTDCELCHTQWTWVPSTFDHDNQYFPIYSGCHAGAWDQCSDCHPNQSNFGVFQCLTCHPSGEMNGEHQGVPGYQYNSQACFNCHPNGCSGGGGSQRKQFKFN